MKFYSVIIACLLLPLLGYSQTIEYKELTSATVTENSTILLNGFSGGFNSTQPCHADLNNDGKNDLTIYDQNTNTLKTFINIGGINSELYQYDPKYAANFPTVRYYLKLIDYNCDGVADLFHRGSSGVSVYTGYFDSNNELKFNFYQELYYPGTFGPVNCYVQPNDIPIIADVDADGDLDVVAFDVLGSYAPLYKNLQVEDNLPCDSIRMILASSCYGQMYQTYWREHVLNANCKGFSSNKKQRHGGNCILTMDINNNGLLDMVVGNSNYNDAQVLYNGGTLSNTLFTSQDSLLDLNGHQLELYSWPAPFYFDIDNDNDKDLIFTPHNDDISSANYNIMGVYENTGTSSTPNFVWKNDSALIGSVLDIGRNSHPTLFDYDKDGKLDLFVGGEGFFNTNIKVRESQLAYYRNTSSMGQISFELVTKDFLNLHTKNYPGLYPNFGDITGDGVDDLLLGNDSGTIIVYENQATSNSMPPNFVWQTDSLPGIDVGEYSFPFVYDFNGDNKTDILIGNEIGVLALYEDTSVVSVQKEFKRIDSAIGNVKGGGVYTYLGFAVPYIAPVDSSNKDYLLLGTAEGIVERYDSFSNSYVNWVEVDSQMAKIQVANRTAPAIGDLDGDQRPELLLGNQNGGLNIYQFVKNTVNSTVDITTIGKKSVPISLFPNPTTHELWIKAPSDISNIENYKIFDISGRLVSKKMVSQKINESIPTSSLTNGLYFIEVSFGKDLRAIGRFMKKN